MYSKRLFVLIALLSVPATAETIAQKSKHKYYQDQFDSQLSFTNQACDAKITGKIDWTGFDGVDTSKVSVGQYCSEAAQALANICHASADNKPAVKAGVTSVSCSYGGEGKRSVALDGKTLAYKVDFKVGATSTQFIQGYVANHI